MLLSVSSPRWREGRNGVTAGLPSVARSQKRSPVKGVGNVLSFCIFFLSCCFCITVPAFNFGFGRSRPTVAAASRVADDSGKGPRLFLDTGDIAEWERCLPLGIFCGLTTNPVLLERAGVPCTLPHIKGLLGRALDFHGTEEVMFQAWGEDVEGLVSTGRSLRDLDPLRVVVKLPLTVAGVKAAAELRRSGGVLQFQTRACGGWPGGGVHRTLLGPDVRLGSCRRQARQRSQGVRAATASYFRLGRQNPRAGGFDSIRRPDD
ncbi:unnamed protein product [Polarella glacialis]|uniref:Transaldolase n=1 Tax=Polarella glacialis TaxID=89957 RepID=A0A813G439_POLGL|nr:unnamed protein product [Polarella glacialis]